MELGFSQRPYRNHITLGVLSTNFCLLSSGPSCAFSFSSFATSSSICGEIKGLWAIHLHSPPPPPFIRHSSLIRNWGRSLCLDVALLLWGPLLATCPPSPSFSLALQSLPPHACPLCRSPPFYALFSFVWPFPCHLGLTCSVLAFCCLRPRTRSP